MSSRNAPPPEPSVTDLAKKVLTDARELVKVEVQLARAELVEELSAAKRAAIATLLAGAVFLTGVSTLVMALVLALGGTPATALIVAAALFCLAAPFGWYAYSAAPRAFLDRSRKHVKEDVAELKEHVA